MPAIFPLFRHIQHSASLAGCRRVLDVHGRVAMGAASSTARLDRITAFGFSVAEARLALEHTNGDVDRAILCLLAKRRQEAAAEQGLANRVNAILRRQRPWPEFFERFLWPEHLHERLSTNLVYYEAPVLGLGSGLGIGSGLGLGLGLGVRLGLGARGGEQDAVMTLTPTPTLPRRTRRACSRRATPATRSCSTNP